MRPREYEDRTARNAAKRQRERDARDAERLAWRLVREAKRDEATDLAIQRYRSEKAKREEKGVTFDGSSGRHPIKHKHEMRSFRIAL